MNSSLSDESEKKEYSTTLHRAVHLLSRREHSAYELDQKLNQKGFDSAFVDKVIARLTAEGLQSDDRFTEAFVRYRANNGRGPQRIQSELRERGVSEKIQAAYLDAGDAQWLECAEQVRCKRFGDAPPEDFKERARQARFLQYRGFTSEQIREVLDDN